MIRLHPGSPSASVRLAVVLLAATCVPRAAGAATITLQAVRDSYIQLDAATSNFGADATLQVKTQSGAMKRALVQFDLSTVASCLTITGATLQMHIDTNTQNVGGDNHTEGAHRVTAAWTETGVTWNKRDAVNNWTTTGADFVATATATAVAPGGTGTFVQWNVLTDVAAFRAGTATNDGWLVKDVNEAVPPVSTIGYASRDGTTFANRPVLVLTVTANDAACADTNPCTVDTCDLNVGCQHTAGNAGSVCRSSAGVCDVAETCTGASPTCPADAFQSSATVCRSAAGVCDVAETCTGASAVCPADAKSTGVCRSSVGVCDVAEACDGVSNGCPADALVASGTVCRSSAGVCDVAETCTGASAACPANGFQPATTVCRPAAGTCDLAESCTGSSPVCPFDGKSTAVCRPAAGACDFAESCDGLGNTCPADVLVASGTVCRSSLGVCDPTESCDGSSPACPADVVAPSGTVCRSSAGMCDVAEACDGSSGVCPGDGFQSSSVGCRPSAGVCDPAENCTGASATCPADAKSTAVCRSSAGACDAAESCDGAGNDCPADVLAGSGSVCRSATGSCDVAETCDGATPTCPADAVQSSGTVCRSAAGVCDVAESCDGSATTCPADAMLPSSTVCRSSAGACDVAESCTGPSAACPADVFAASGAVCRPVANPCDVAEVCSGTSASCPADTVGAADSDGDGVCDSVDECPNTPDPGQADTDGDGIGDACDPCTSGSATDETKITFSKLDPPGGDDKFKLKGLVTLPFPYTPALDPVTKGVRVIVHDGGGGTVLDATIPGGVLANGTGWRTSGTVYRYKNGEASPPPALAGIKKVVLLDLSGHNPGQIKFTVTGKNSTYAIASLPLTATLVIDSPLASSGQCGEVTFPGPPGVLPSCAFSGTNFARCK